MGGILSKKCQTCERQIKDAGIFAGKINCDNCATIIRTPLPSAHRCACCNKMEPLKYKCSINDFFLCDGCSDMARSHMTAFNFIGLDIMKAAIESHGHTIPKKYIEAIDKARTAVQKASKSAQCNGCYELKEVSYNVIITDRFLCAECAEDYRFVRRECLKGNEEPFKRWTKNLDKMIKQS